MFDARGRPTLRGIVVVSEFGVRGEVAFRVDTGADQTTLHLRDTLNLAIPLSRLSNPFALQGIGGSPRFYRQPATLVFKDERTTLAYRVDLAIAAPTALALRLPSLLGQDILRYWHMAHAPSRGLLEFDALQADFTLMS